MTEISELVGRFAEIGVAQDRALLDDSVARFNQLYREKVKVRDALRAMPGDQRRALTVLYDHPNFQVRLNAAKSTLAIEPVAARRLIEAIAAARIPHQSLEAGMTLYNLDKGVFVPA
jgi:hypothetical protein